jgi:hypothetical protein
MADAKTGKSKYIATTVLLDPGNALGLKERAKQAGNVSVKTLRREIENGRLGCARIGRRIVITDRQWAEYIELISVKPFRTNLSGAS